MTEMDNLFGEEQRFQARTEREIPVVVLERKRAAGHETTIRGGTQ